MTPQSHVLLVDDNELNRDALSRRLIQRGYRVTVAAGGPEALALAAEASHDIVLLDVEMPGMSGLEVLTTLRDSRSQTELPIIMVTARTQEAEIVEAFRLGANDYVTKPIDFPVALARIETHLSHKRAVEALRESEERYALASSGANDGLWDWNLATDCVFWSARWKAMLGHDADDISASPDEWFSRVHHEDVARLRASLTEHLRDGSGHYESEHRILHSDGSYRYMLCRGAAVRGADGTATRLAGSLTDITERKVADPLTGLPNRLLFVEVLDRAIKRTERRPEYLFALLILGLDRFKSVNATCGLLTADRLLVAVARRLQSSLRATDAITRDRHEITLARLGSDEFTVLLDDIADAGDAMLVAERLRAALEGPFDVGGQQIFTSATVGIAVSATGYETPEEILRDASIALHRAKAHGVARVELFDPAMRDRAMTRLRIETELRSAIENRELAVYYQPIISLVSGEISAFEALVRWHHPVRGLIGPNEFIPVAEETGMILQIARLTLLESCRQMVAWQCQFGAGAPALMCVNISSRQFKNSDLAIETEAVLRQTGLTPSSLKLEITESAFIDDVQAAQRTLSALQDLGVAWSLDDFGTGYSSLSYLHRLRVNTVKADRSFVSRIGDEAEGPEMVRAIVAMAHNLGMDVVAEGVETANQLTQLRALGCDHVQGFLFSQAVNAATAGALIGSRPWQHYATSVLEAPLDVVLSY